MDKARVKNGVDNIEKYAAVFEKKRLGLITGPSGVNKSLRSTVEVIHNMFELTALYSPEHGLMGNIPAGKHVDSYIDERTGIKVYSLYGKLKKPTDDMLKDIDVLVMDLQDIGSRYYTYLYTMTYAMQSCAENDKVFVLLDRVNPINGNDVEGNILDIQFKSFVGMYPIVQRYGLTMGELAQFINEEFDIRCQLEIAKVEGWKREMYYDETDLIWVQPSPNIPTLDTAVLYNGTCLFEGTNISEGRGTTKPFEMIGAPWLDAYRLSDLMNGKKLPGVVFRPICFEPTYSKHKNELCQGVQVHITDRNSIKPVELGLHLLYAVIDMDKKKFQWLPPFKEGGHYFIDLLAGTDEIRHRIYEVEGIIEKWRRQNKTFCERKKKYHLY